MRGYSGALVALLAALQFGCVTGEPAVIVLDVVTPASDVRPFEMDDPTLAQPIRLAVVAGKVLVVDPGANAIHVLDGALEVKVSVPISSDPGFRATEGVEVFGATDLWVKDRGRVRQLDWSGTVVRGVDHLPSVAVMAVHDSVLWALHTSPTPGFKRLGGDGSATPVIGGPLAPGSGWAHSALLYARVQGRLDPEGNLVLLDVEGVKVWIGRNAVGEGREIHLEELGVPRELEVAAAYIRDRFRARVPEGGTVRVAPGLQVLRDGYWIPVLHPEILGAVIRASDEKPALLLRDPSGSVFRFAWDAVLHDGRLVVLYRDRIAAFDVPGLATRLPPQGGGP